MNSWLIRSNPAEQAFAKLFLENDYIGVGWGESGDLTGKNYDEIKQIVSDKYTLTGRKVSIPLSVLYHFTNSIQEGDLVVMPEGYILNFGVVESDYYYDQEDMLIAHRRKVAWQKRQANRDDLSDGLRSSLKSLRTLADLSAHTTEVFSFLESSPVVITSDVSLLVTLVLSNNREIKINGLPARMAPNEVDAVCDQIRDIYRSK